MSDTSEKIGSSTSVEQLLREGPNLRRRSQLESLLDMPETSQRLCPSPTENSILESLNSKLDSHLEIPRSEAQLVTKDSPPSSKDILKFLLLQSLLEDEDSNSNNPKKVVRRTNTLGPNVDSDPDQPESPTTSPERQARARGNLNKYLPLYKAALRGDWETAKAIFDGDESALTAKITFFEENALHLAAGAGHAQFVIIMMDRIPVEDLELRDVHGRTALTFAAMAGCTEAARAMVSRNPRLTQLMDKNGRAPILDAALIGSKDVLSYLCSVMRNEEPNYPLSSEAGGRLLNNIIASDHYDVALQLLQKYPELALCRDESRITPLDVLAQRPSAFPSATHLSFWQRLIYSSISLNHSNKEDYSQYGGRGDTENPSQNPATTHASMLLLVVTGYRRMKDLFWRFVAHVPLIKEVYNIKLKHNRSVRLMKLILDKISTMDSSEVYEYFLRAHILSTATENGIVEIVIECVRHFPDLLWLLTNDRSVFHIAIENRQEKIFSLIYGLSAHKKVLGAFRVDNGNNMLHLAAKLAPPSELNSVSGAALQMQRELQWFKAVENVVDPSCKLLTNSKGKTPRALFTEEHKDLLEKGEKWMKDTATSCMVVATLIATVAFASAFTVPGGNNQDSGYPIFLKTTSFMVFVISDAIALCSSSTSVLMFLSILTARYAEDDFLKPLPMRLIIGLATLFVSIAAMVTAFTATLWIVTGRQYSWFIVPIVLLACLPVTLFALLQLPLFVQMFRSTFGSGIFNPRRDHVIY